MSSEFGEAILRWDEDKYVAKTIRGVSHEFPLWDAVDERTFVVKTTQSVSTALLLIDGRSVLN